MTTYFHIILRVGLAMLIGILIGRQRELLRKPAGMRTHMLVALGACIVTITGQLLTLTLSQYGGSFDPGRLACQVIPGIGFLGAGVIMQSKGSTTGISTAAGVWTTACIGICIGAGYYGVGLLGSFIIFMVLSMGKRELFIRAASIVTVRFLATEDPEKTAEQIKELAHRCSGSSLHITHKENKEGIYDTNLSIMHITLRFTGSQRNQNIQEFSFQLASLLTTPHLEILISD